MEGIQHHGTPSAAVERKIGFDGWTSWQTSPAKPIHPTATHPANMLFLQTLSIIPRHRHHHLDALLRSAGYRRPAVNKFSSTHFFRTLLVFFRIRLKRTTDYETRDRVMAIFAPIGLFADTGHVDGTMLIGFTFVYWGAGVQPVREAFILSGSSLLTQALRGMKTGNHGADIYAGDNWSRFGSLVDYVFAFYLQRLSARERNVALFRSPCRLATVSS